MMTIDRRVCDTCLYSAADAAFPVENIKEFDNESGATEGDDSV